MMYSAILLYLSDPRHKCKVFHKKNLQGLRFYTNSERKLALYNKTKCLIFSTFKERCQQVWSAYETHALTALIKNIFLFGPKHCLVALPVHYGLWLLTLLSRPLVLSGYELLGEGIQTAACVQILWEERC